jgi:hypothetical protein
MDPFGNGPPWQQLQLSAVSQSPLSSPTIMGMAAAGTEGADIRAAVAATQAVVDMEAVQCTRLVGVAMQAAATQVAVHRTWLAVGIGVVVDTEVPRALTRADKRQRAEGIPEAAITSPMPIAVHLRIKPADTRINRFPQIQEKASRDKTGQTARLNIGQ